MNRKMLRHFFAGGRKQPQKSQKRNCPILNLPVDLILPIAEYLPLCSQVFLSETCRSMQSIFVHFRALIHISDEERLEFLVDRVRNLPSRWLCEVCLKLHQVHLQDTPKHTRTMTCPLGWQQLRERGYSLMSFQIDHRHVQLALKYTRMKDVNNVYQEYLKALLKPVYTSFFTHPGFTFLLQTMQATYPKVVDGRYLIQSVYSYLAAHTAVTRGAVGDLEVCLHQGFYSTWDLPWRHSSSLSDAMDAAFHDIGHEKCGSCPLCLTDFSVYITPERAIVRVWQDLGPEGSALEPAWGTHTHAFRSKYHGRYVYHEPGSIRVFHDQGGEVIEFGSV
ncbi:hypothetical protein TOPH_04341 [Tolypocladium ophioglossoides CBS 100239]|uniref:F-box domain-containing protein n=1 Tax=Tolypocladium ophioglossoides (strain CBS 100239) TaxID=1163406 RepID=A0A0L0NAB0_TOLOC|nr:hypothetical protein TOPH_04341 [Tolypocladium ophioglossoides CBS 100239]